MNIDFKALMGSVLDHTRNQRLGDATKLIQEALGTKAASPQEMTDITPAKAKPAVPRPHRALKDVVNTIRRKKPVRAPKKTHVIQPAIPPGAEFAEKMFTCAAGARSYKLYVPANRPEGKRPLIIMLHGCTQNPDDFAVGTGMNELAEAHGMLVAYPSQPKSANPSACWNWFSPHDQMRGQGEPLIIAGITEDIMEAHDVDPARVFVAGLSAGGAMAAVMGATYPELYNAVGVHSGLPHRSAVDVISAFAAMRGEGLSAARGDAQSVRSRMIVFHGDADKTVHASNGERIIEGVAFHSGVSEQGTAEGGRRYTQQIFSSENGERLAEHWIINGGVHAWSGGDARGSYTDPRGPDASREMVRFFLEE